MKRNEIENVPMFDVTPPPPTPRNREAGTARFGPQSIRRVLCAAGAHVAGLILSGDSHLVWREHQVHAGGSAWQCSASGRCLCDCPAPPVTGVVTPGCGLGHVASGWHA